MDIKEYISSGILEQYVLGTISEEESLNVDQMAIIYPEIREEIITISNVLEQYALANAVAPSRTIKPFLMATIDYMERMENGEQPSLPPVLNETSNIIDYANWLNRNDMVLPAESIDLYAKIIGHAPGAITAIVWIKEDAPVESHNDEYEKFLIVEGSCDIIVEDTIHPLVVGDYFAIPLHKKHQVRVTSATHCKVILQRIAA